MIFSMEPVGSPLTVSAVVSTVLIAAWTDWSSWRIPNALVAGSAVAAAMLAIFGGNGIGLWRCLGGGAIGFALFLPLYMLKGMAAGDVKLMTAIGMHVGSLMVIDIVLMTCLIGGAWAIVLMDLRKGTGPFTWLLLQLQSTAALSPRMRDGQDNDTVAGQDRLKMIPYGVVIAMATLGVMVFTRI